MEVCGGDLVGFRGILGDLMDFEGPLGFRGFTGFYGTLVGFRGVPMVSLGFEKNKRMDSATLLMAIWDGGEGVDGSEVLDFFVIFGGRDGRTGRQLAQDTSPSCKTPISRNVRANASQKHSSQRMRSPCLLGTSC